MYDDDFKQPIKALPLALALGMRLDSYMTGCHDEKGNKLFYLHRTTAKQDIIAFNEMYANYIPNSL